MKILVTDDDKHLRNIMKIELSEEGFEVDDADSGQNALEALEKEDVDVMLLDLNMPGMDGMEVLKKIKGSEIPTEVIILTGHASVATAVDAMKLGAYDYLTKPFKIEELKVIIQKAFERKKLISENILLKTQIKRQSESQKIITTDSYMLEIMDTVKKIAASDLAVLITGESGVGKELISREIHETGKRSEAPFVPINCGSIPENMLESELFGHEKGSFTGAHARKLGLLEVADNGTLFLDEIGEMPLNLQVKLLRVLETGKFYRVGGVKEISVDVRFVSATNKTLEVEVEKQKFRSDLYYRISALTVHVPPLRNRKGDIPLLIEHFITRNPDYRNRQFSSQALDILREYSWPGNIRELQNFIHSIMLLSESGVIDAGSLPEYISDSTKDPGKTLEDVARQHILRIYRECGGHKGKTAKILGIDPKTLYRKLVGYGVKD